MNAVIYARVSTGRQAKKDLSIPAQFDMMRSFAQQHGWHVVKEVKEPGITAKTPDRPALQALLASLPTADPHVDILLVWKFDRWMRSVFDHLLVKRQLQEMGVRLVSVCEPVDETAQGKFFEHLMASANEYHSDNLASNVMMGMRKKVQLGGWPHRPPRGYTLVYDRDGQSRVEPHPSEAVAIATAFERYATGRYSLRALAESLKDDGIVSKKGERLALAYVRHLLTNPFYVGRLKWKALEAPGQHEPLVSRQLFDRVAVIIKSRYKDPGAKGRVTGFPLRGVAICASCRGHMTASWHKKRFGYYHCARRAYNRRLCPSAHYCPARLVEDQVRTLCGSLQLSDDVAARTLELADAKIEERAAKTDRLVHSLRNRRSALAERELTLTEKYVAGEVMPDPYQRLSKKIRTELAAVESAMEKATVDAASLRTAVREMIQRARTVQDLSDRLGPRARPALLQSVFTNVVLGADGLVGFTLRKPLDAIFKVGPMPASASKVETVASKLVDHLTEELATSAIHTPAA